MVCASVRVDNPRALARGLSPHADATPYNNLLIAPAFIYTLCIVRYKAFYMSKEFMKHDI